MLCVFSSDDKDEQSSSNVLLELENIDDELDQKGIAFVKIDNEAEAQEYGIEELPALVYFELGIPTVYEGKRINLENPQSLFDSNHHLNTISNQKNKPFIW